MIYETEYGVSCRLRAVIVYNVFMGFNSSSISRSLADNIVNTAAE